jgi:septum formation protein
VSPGQLILASASPRRAELLSSAGYTFSIRPAEIDETPRDGEAPVAYVLRVAREKAAHIAAQGLGADETVLAADTTVVAAGKILGKPSNRAEAVEMLERLSGAVHEVHTAVVVRGPGGERSAVVTTRVRFVPLSDADIAWYVDSGETEGKAGAYAIQGRAARFIDWIEGSWSNVVGLPVATVHALLSRTDGSV